MSVVLLFFYEPRGCFDALSDVLRDGVHREAPGPGAPWAGCSSGREWPLPPEGTAGAGWSTTHSCCRGSTSSPSPCAGSDAVLGCALVEQREYHCCRSDWYTQVFFQTRLTSVTVITIDIPDSFVFRGVVGCCAWAAALVLLWDCAGGPDCVQKPARHTPLFNYGWLSSCVIQENQPV